jgi:EpsI family protein
MHKALALFLLTQTALVYWAATGEQPPAIPDFTQFPRHIKDWNSEADEPIAGEIRDNLKADQLLSRVYTKGTTPASLLIAWFQTQTSGSRQPHSPQVCLPGSGWTPILTDVLDISGPVNRSIVTNHGQQAVVLYWYQSSQRSIASEWTSKLWTIWDALTIRRTDLALIRVVVWPRDGDYARATSEGSEFIQAIRLTAELTPSPSAPASPWSSSAIVRISRSK